MCEDVDWIKLAQEMVQSRTFRNKVMNICIQENEGKVLFINS
jgi:hypothetical protein